MLDQAGGQVLVEDGVGLLSCGLILYVREVTGALSGCAVRGYGYLERHL